MSAETVKTEKTTAKFSLKELSDIFNFNCPNNEQLFSICTDSRTINKNQIFLPLSGEKFDGHNFINEILGKGISFSFCDVRKISKVDEKLRKSLILVDNTLDAYHRVASYYRDKINPKVIAITGSSGKTTVKELITSVILQKHKVHKTKANFNNEIGVPKTILEMLEDTEILVLELAMRAKGEINFLSRTAKPDVAVITNVGSAHIGRLGNLQSIMEAKSEILEHIKVNGTAILNNDLDLIKLAKMKLEGRNIQFQTFDLNEASNISFKDGRATFTFKNKNYTVNATGQIHVLNSICAIKLAHFLKLSDEEIKKGLLEFKLPEGRGNIIRLKDNMFLVDESYNANPDSLKVAVTNLIECWGKDYNKILVIGELAELGEHENKLLKELNTWLLDRKLSCVITVGDKLKEIKNATNVKNTNECCAILNKLLIPKSVVLIKGSHIAGLEKVVNYFIEKQ